MIGEGPRQISRLIHAFEIFRQENCGVIRQFLFRNGPSRVRHTFELFRHNGLEENYLASIPGLFVSWIAGRVAVPLNVLAKVEETEMEAMRALRLDGDVSKDEETAILIAC